VNGAYDTWNRPYEQNTTMDEFGIPKMKLTTRLQHNGWNSWHKWIIRTWEEIHVHENLYRMHGHSRWILNQWKTFTWSYSCKVMNMANVQYHMNESLTWMKLSEWWTVYLCPIMHLVVHARKLPAHQLCLVTSVSGQVTEHSLNTYPPQLHLITLVTGSRLHSVILEM
jgi:hypothetical protein